MALAPPRSQRGASLPLSPPPGTMDPDITRILTLNHAAWLASPLTTVSKRGNRVLQVSYHLSPSRSQEAAEPADKPVWLGWKPALQVTQSMSRVFGPELASSPE